MIDTYLYMYIYIVTTKRMAVSCQSQLLRNLSQNPSLVKGFPLQLIKESQPQRPNIQNIGGC